MNGRRSDFFEAPDAERRLQHAESFLRTLDPNSGALILAPTPSAALWLLARVLDPAQARVGWYRRTPSMLAEELALPELARRELVPVRGLGCEALCARVIHEVGRRGELGRYTALRERPGFARALAATIEQLRLADVGVEPLSEHDPALGRLLSAYEVALADAKLADRALVLAAARDGAARGHATGGLPLLAVDVLLSEHAEAEFARALCSDRALCCAVHPSGDERSSQRWRLALGDEVRDGAPQPQGAPVTDLSRLQERLFSLDTEATVPSFVRGRVQIIASPGEGREAVEVARVALAAAEQGVAFDRMAIVLRAVENYRAVVEEALARAQIPAHFADGVRRPTPEGRALLALLRCAQAGLSARAFAEYLSLSVMPALELDAEAGSVSPRHWERLLVEAAVIGGRERWSRRLTGHARALQDEIDALDAGDPARERRALQLSRLRALELNAGPILDALVALPEGGRWSEWLAALDALARQTLRAPTAVCETLAELAPLAGLGPVTLREVLRVLNRRLGSVITRSTGAGAGKLLVGGIEDVLGRSFERVFVMGLAEKIFPARLDPDPLLPDAVRAQFGGRLAQADDRVTRERLAMRIAVGAARDRVVLSFPRFDVQHNRARVPSFYGLEALRAIDGKLPAFDELTQRADTGAASRLGWPAPNEPAQAIDDAEYDLAMLTHLRAHPSAQKGAARYFLVCNPHLARSLRFRARRWTLSRFVAADGLVLDEKNLPLLAPHQLDARTYSATALSHFAACPYKFYLHAIAGVSPAEPPLDLDELDARQRGVLFHATQRAVLEALRERGWLPLQPSEQRAASELLEREFERMAGVARDAYAPAIGRVFDVALEATRADLTEWLSRLGAETSWQAIHMELGFGLKRRELDPHSRAQAVRLESGLTLAGAIDVVERRGSQDAEGRIVLRATDHKTGTPPDKLGTIGGGRVLQPLLYALALERLFPEARVESGRLYFCTSHAGFLSHEVALDVRSRQACSQLSDSIGALLGAGFLPAAPDAGECGRCDYQPVCGPYEEERVGRIKNRPQEIDRLGPLFRIRVAP